MGCLPLVDGSMVIVVGHSWASRIWSTCCHKSVSAQNEEWVPDCSQRAVYCWNHIHDGCVSCCFWQDLYLRFCAGCRRWSSGPFFSLPLAFPPHTIVLEGGMRCLHQYIFSSVCSSPIVVWIRCCTSPFRRRIPHSSWSQYYSSPTVIPLGEKSLHKGVVNSIHCPSSSQRTCGNPNCGQSVSPTTYRTCSAPVRNGFPAWLYKLPFASALLSTAHFPCTVPQEVSDNPPQAIPH